MNKNHLMLNGKHIDLTSEKYLNESNSKRKSCPFLWRHG